MKNKKAVFAKNTVKWSCKNRIGIGLGEKDFAVLSLLEKQTHWAGIEIPVKADEIPFCIFKISIMGKALGHGVICGFVRE